MKSFTASALDNFPLVKSGDNIAEIIVEVAGKNDLRIEDGDIIALSLIHISEPTRPY